MVNDTLSITRRPRVWVPVDGIPSTVQLDANLKSLNDSGATGKATFEFKGRKVKVRIDAFSGHALEAGMLVVLGAGLVLENLAIELVDQQVDGCVQVLREASHVHILAAQAQGNLGALALLFFGEVVDSQDDCDIDDVIEMAPDAL